MSDVDGYVPWDPCRICDTCGELRRMSSIRKLPGGVTACDLDAGERSAVELDRANARQKPFLFLPVKNARPENNTGPENYEADEGPIFNFIARAVASMERYEDCLNGDTAATTLGDDRIGALAWSGVYLYGIINENKRPLKWITRATTLLAACATALMANQVGFGISTTATRATSAFYGAILEPDATSYVTENTTMGGLALLYYHRISGSLRALDAARAAANYVRNVQAIGSNGTHFTSSDAGGTARLYTGAVASSVSTTSGMYSDSLFYPSGLLALKLWKELTATNGDQSIGATAVVTGFDTAPSQLMSTSMSDMRAFWLTGYRDAGTLDAITGLSATTPREFFNAYPSNKPHTTVVGTGKWEYQDGDADTGTTVSAQNFAKALNALYFYEGGSTQVTTVDAWLRSFDSNPEFETPDGTSTRNLYRSLTGEYDPTYTLSTLLLVRDADDSYAAIAENGSDLYDWGAFGLLAQAWNGLHTSSFIESRKVPLGRSQRFYDGRPTDGDHYDRITTLGRSGLTLQTYLVGADDSGSSGRVTSPAPGMFWWGISDDPGIVANGSDEVTLWPDKSTYNKSVIDSASSGGKPHIQADVLNGRQGIRFSRILEGNRFLESIGLPFTIQPTDPLTVYTVCIPINAVGGALFAANGEGDTVPPNRSFMVYRDGGGTQYGAADFSGPDCIITPTVNYAGQTLIVAHYSEYNSGTGLIDVWMSINGNPMTFTHSTMLTGSARDRFFVGGYFMTGGLFQGGFDGYIMEQYAYLANLRGTSGDDRNLVYANNEWVNPVTVVSVDQVNDAVRASQFASSFRYSVNYPPQV